MGDDKSGTTTTQKPQPPALPADAPKDLQDFVACTADSFAFNDGPVTWLDVTPKPNLSIKAGTVPGTATITVSVLGFPISLPAWIANGALTIDTTNQTLLPDAYADEIKRFVDALNAWFAANGKGLAPPAWGLAGMTLTKVPSPGQAAKPPPPAVVAPPSMPDTHPSPHADGPEPAPYLETKVEPPPLPKGEAFGPYSKAGPPPPLEDVGTGSANPVTGASGPGGPKAPAGMGNLARYAFVATIIAALAIGAVAFLGRPQAAVPAATSVPSTPASAAPAATVIPPSLAATSAPGATPNGVANGRFEIVSDTTVSSCRHEYEVAFRVFDSSGNGAVYAGKPVTFQVLDGEVLTATAGAGGTWTISVAEDFQKTSSGCFSRLRPKVLTVDGQPAF